MLSRLADARRALIAASRIRLGALNGSQPYMGPFEVILIARTKSLAQIRETISRTQKVPKLPGDRSSGMSYLPFSDDEQRILDSLEAKPLPLKQIWEAAGIAETKCKTLLANLKARRVLETTDEGYRIIRSEQPGAE